MRGARALDVPGCSCCRLTSRARLDARRARRRPIGGVVTFVREAFGMVRRQPPVGHPYSDAAARVAAGQPTDAYGHLRTHAVRAPNDGLGWIALGQACEARGDEPEARRAYLRALRVSTHHEAVVAREALDRLPARALLAEPWA